MTAPATTLCPHCGTAFSAGVCPRCALVSGLAEEHEIDPGMVPGYRLREKIGEGGMGEVFLAEQVNPVPREVALKRMKHSADGGGWLLRFNHELEALALLDHRDVATVFDAGVSEDGRPFYTMELVDGLPLTLFCDRARLGVRERLKLFARVCAAVDYAHRRGVWHGDLKPSNILAAPGEGAEPELKLIDFGVRRASLAGGEDGHRMSAMFTPGYASPESCAGGGWDSRNDLYSLGIVLAELIGGHQPGKCQVAPDAALAAARATTPRALARLLREDVDWIVARASAPDPAARYPSAAEMGADIQRVLDGRPVTARPASLRYTLGKFMRRERRRLLLTGAAALLISTIAGGLLLQQRSLRRSREEMARVHSEAQKATRQTKTLQEFTSRLVSLTRGPDAAARDAGLPHILEQTAQQAAALAEEDPDAAVSLLSASASAAAAFDRADLAIDQWRKALAILEARGLSPGDARLIALTGGLARVCLQAGDNEEAVRLLTPLAGSAALGELPPENRIDVLTDLARAHFAEREFQSALQWAEKASAATGNHFGVTHPLTLHAVLLSGKALTELQRYQEARTALSRAAGGLESCGDPAAPDAAAWLKEVEQVLRDREEGE